MQIAAVRRRSVTTFGCTNDHSIEGWFACTLLSGAMCRFRGISPRQDGALAAQATTQYDSAAAAAPIVWFDVQDWADCAFGLARSRGSLPAQCLRPSPFLVASKRLGKNASLLHMQPRNTNSCAGSRPSPACPWNHAMGDVAVNEKARPDACASDRAGFHEGRDCGLLGRATACCSSQDRPGCTRSSVRHSIGTTYRGRNARPPPPSRAGRSVRSSGRCTVGRLRR